MLGLRMDVSRFTPNSPGRLVPITWYDLRSNEANESLAFLPDPLPDRIALSDRLLLKLIDATAAVTRLDEASKRLPNPSLLVRPSIMREAVSTSALEGTYTLLKDVMEASFIDGQLTGDVREVTNYVEAAFAGFERIETRAISVGLLRELHPILVAGAGQDSYQSGELRAIQVFIGERRRGIAAARFVPPPPGFILADGMNAWEQWINTEEPIPTLVKVALGHYQFETLHPFIDGNGRLGRLIMGLQLVHEGLLHIPILNISPFLEEHRNEYIDLMLHVSQTGDVESWMDFIFDGVLIQAEDARTRIGEMMRVEQTIREAVKRSKARGVIHEVIEDLIAYPVITIPKIAELHNVQYGPAKNAVDKLVQLGFLEEVTGKTYGKIHVCQQMMHAIEGDIQR